MSTLSFRAFCSRLRVLSALAIALTATACQYLPSTNNLLSRITPYRLEVVQGNVVTREQVALIKPGLSRAQVRDVLGSPLLADPFHADRWDYVFTIRRQGAEPQLRRIVAVFKNDVLDHVDTGGELPSEREFVALIDTYRPPSTPPPLALTEEQLKALPTPVQPAASEPVPTTPTRTYPPLEPRS